MSAAVQSLATKAAQEALKTKLEQATAVTRNCADLVGAVRYELENNTPLKPLATSWKELEDAIMKNRWAARDVATRTQTSMEQLSTGVIPIVIDDSVDAEERTATVQQIVDSAVPDGKTSSGLAQAFTENQKSIAGFQSKIDEASKDQSAQIQKLNTEITSLQGELDQANSKLGVCQSQLQKLKDEISALKVEIGSLTGSKDPNDKEKLEELRAKVAALEDEVQEVEGRIAPLKTQVASLTTSISNKKASRTAAEKVNASLQKSSQAINDIAQSAIQSVIQHITAVPEVWNGMDKDLQSIEAYIKNPTDVPPIIAIFNTDGSVYDIIQPALTAFAVGIVGK